MNIAIDIPTAVIVSAVWVLLGLALLARRHVPARPKPGATPRARKPQKKPDRQIAPVVSTDG